MKRSTHSDVVFPHGDSVDFPATLQNLAARVRFDHALVTTTLPRGGLQVIQPQTADPAWQRTYSREHHLLDVVAWGAMTHHAPQRLSNFLDERGNLAGVAEAFGARALKPFGYGSYACAPLSSPLLQGYPGVLHLFRQTGAEDFSDDDLERLSRFAEALETALIQARRERAGEIRPVPTSRHLPIRQIVVGSGGSILVPARPPDPADPLLRKRLLGKVRERVAAVGEPGVSSNGNGDASGADGLAAGPARSQWLAIKDSEEFHRAFRIVLLPSLPALTGAQDEPVAVVSWPPECDDWTQLRAGDIAADKELARMIPALHYMREHFGNGANLNAIARSVHLSPFHFHRRFSELLGITPKQFLFECQIAEAKRQLAAGELPLAEIARNAGFAHQSHFTSRFRQSTGMTPTRWRRAALQAKQPGREARKGG